MPKQVRLPYVRLTLLLSNMATWKILNCTIYLKDLLVQVLYVSTIFKIQNWIFTSTKIKSSYPRWNVDYHKKMPRKKWVVICQNTSCTNVSLICNIDDLTWVATHHHVDLDLFTFWFSIRVLSIYKSCKIVNEIHLEKVLVNFCNCI